MNELIGFTGEADTKISEIIDKTSSARTLREAMFAIGVNPDTTKVVDLCRLFLIEIMGGTETIARIIDKPLGEWSDEDIKTFDEAASESIGVFVRG